MKDTDIGYIIQDGDGQFWCGLNKYSDRMVNAQIYKRKENALAAGSKLTQPIKLYTVIVEWDAEETTI